MEAFPTKVLPSILKLARTIADLAGCEEIQSVHLAKALHAAQPPQVDAQHCVLS